MKETGGRYIAYEVCGRCTVWSNACRENLIEVKCYTATCLLLAKSITSRDVNITLVVNSISASNQFESIPYIIYDVFVCEPFQNIASKYMMSNEMKRHKVCVTVAYRKTTITFVKSFRPLVTA